MGDVDIPVRWEVAADFDAKFVKVVASGTEVASAAHGHSVHALASALESNTWYRYRFSVGSRLSAVGRTRTTPANNATAAKLSFGFASCQDWQAGYYNAWRDMATVDLDLLLFLGDYIYEYGESKLGGAVRQHNSDEVTDLAGYRNRYALYKSDPLLQAAHLRCPWVVIWDDHEVENNYADDHSEDDSVPTAAFLARRAAAYQAWWEHQPVRLDPPNGPDLKIYRTQHWGKLANFFMLDTRQYRTDQACGDKALQLTTPACAEVTEPGRTLTGDEEERWLLDQLDASKATWNVLGNQVVMTDLRLGKAVLNYDQWDGYPAERQRLLEHLDTKGITNCVVVTGDIHLGGVGDLQIDDGAGGKKTVATEFVGTSISSVGLIPPDLEASARGLLKDAKYLNSHQRGWVRCEVTPKLWTSEYRVVTDNLVEESPVTIDGTFTVTPTTPGAIAV